jgi:hypothetical protein
MCDHVTQDLLSATGQHEDIARHLYIGQANRSSPLIQSTRRCAAKVCFIVCGDSPARREIHTRHPESRQYARIRLRSRQQKGRDRCTCVVCASFHSAKTHLPAQVQKQCLYVEHTSRLYLSKIPVPCHALATLSVLTRLSYIL